MMGKAIKSLREECRNEYARGYQCGARWPLHKPPFPPEPIINELVQSLQALRDAIDGELAKFDENDPICKILDPYIECVDKAQESLSVWLLDREPARAGRR